MLNPENKRKISLLIIFIILVLSNAYFIFKSVSLSTEAAKMQNNVQTSEKNSKISEFFVLFVDKVLKSEGEIDFNTRLDLENSVRATKDEELLVSWQNFTDSKTEQDAQKEVKNLLGVIAKKLK